MIRVIIERHIKPNKFDDYTGIIRRAKKDAAKKSGFMGGEMYFDAKENNKVVIIAAWDSMDNWNSWDASDERKVLTTELEALLESEEKVTVLQSTR